MLVSLPNHEPGESLLLYVNQVGRFLLSSDGLLSYTGGDAHVNDGSNFDESKLEMAQMWKYNPDSLIIIEYLLRDN